MDGKIRLHSLFCIMMFRTLFRGQPKLHLFATEAPPCHLLPTLSSSVLVRPREGCTIDISSAAEPEKASCCWCPEPCLMLRMFWCAEAKVLGGFGRMISCWRAAGRSFCDVR